MAVRVDWHEDAVVAQGAGSSPLDVASSSPMGAVVTNTLGLTASAEQIRERLVRLFGRERFLAEKCGLTCPIKEHGQSCCAVCPLNEANDSESRKGSLCKVGVEQEQAETLLAIKLADGL